MLRSPKERFVASAHAAGFKKVLNDPAFEEATLAALLQMQSQTPLDCSPNQAASSHDQMAGARKYLETLCSIANPEPKPKRDAAQELHYEERA